MSTYGMEPAVFGQESESPPLSQSVRSSQGGIGISSHVYRQVSHQQKGKQLPAAPIPDFDTWTHSADPIGLGSPIGHLM